jgi:hypothetical protein
MFKIDRKDADARVVAAQAVKPPPDPPKIEVAPDPIERRLLYTLQDSMSFVAVHESVHGRYCCRSRRLKQARLAAPFSEPFSPFALCRAVTLGR